MYVLSCYFSLVEVHQLAFHKKFLIAEIKDLSFKNWAFPKLSLHIQMLYSILNKDLHI